ncbi:Lysine-rich arabinogalactan protein 18 [Glycine soja]|nr:Lysine-rich arabinogalactan protein 18 [Glycine soja]
MTHVSSPPTPISVSSPPAPVPVSSPPALAPTTPAPVVAPSAEVPAPAPKSKKKTKKSKKHTAPAPSPSLLGPPAPPVRAPGSSQDSMSPGPAVSEDESGAETIRCLKKVIGCLALSWATLVLFF